MNQVPFHLHMMRANARDSPPYLSSTTTENENLHLALVFTLASIVLLIFILRIRHYIKFRQTFHLNDWTALLATIATLGLIITFACLVRFGVWTQTRNDSSSNYENPAINAWFLAMALCYLVSIGFVKISLTLFSARVCQRKYYQYPIYGITATFVILNLEWFILGLLQCPPLSGQWKSRSPSGPRCIPPTTYAVLALINNVINSGANVFLAVILLAVICVGHITLATRLWLTTVFCLGSISCGASIFRTHVIYNDSEDGKYYDHEDILFTLLGIVEATTGLMAASILSLGPFPKPCSSPLGNNEQITSRIPPFQPRSTQAPNNDRHSNCNLIDHPNPDSSPSSHTHFHEDFSNLDFDLEPFATRMRSHTLQSFGTLRSSLSGWSQFSGFTYYTTPAEARDAEHRWSRSPGISMVDLEQVVFQGLSLRTEACESMSDIGVAVSTVAGHEHPHPHHHRPRHETNEEPETSLLRKNSGLSISERRKEEKHNKEDTLIIHAM